MSEEMPTAGEAAPVRVPGFLSVKAAAHYLGIRERSILGLIERNRLPSTRLGRMHFIPTRSVRAYGVERRLRMRRGRKGTHRAA